MVFYFDLNCSPHAKLKCSECGKEVKVYGAHYCNGINQTEANWKRFQA